VMQCRDAKVLGMETQAFEEVVDTCEDLRKHLVDVVLAIQNNIDCDIELIRAHSESSSLSARLFARELGVAVANGAHD
jgi:hypothetical protein